MLLQVVGWATVATGLIMFFVFIQANFANWISFGWIISGIVSGSLFLGLAHVVGMLEDIQARLPSAYTPSSGSRGQASAFQDE